MDQQQQELRQAAAQAFMESLELLEEYLHDAESNPESNPNSDAKVNAESILSSKTQVPTNFGKGDRSVANSGFLRATHKESKLDKESAHKQSKPDKPHQLGRSSDPTFDLAALEEAVADIEQFMTHFES